MKQTNAFDNYLEGLEAYRKGDRKNAADKLAKALGANKATDVMVRSLDVVFNLKTPLHRAVVDALVAEERKRRYRR